MGFVTRILPGWFGPRLFGAGRFGPGLFGPSLFGAGLFGAFIAVGLGGLHPARAETLLERGGYLVNGIANCGNCHSPQNADGTLAGPELSGGKALLGSNFTIYPPNITPDAATGIGRWTDSQVVTALREGRAPDGTMLHPPMPIPFYRGVSDRDALAIAIYIRSVPAVRNTVPPSQFPGPAPAAYGPPLGTVVAPDPADPVAHGRYLAQLGHCLLCHSPTGADGRPDIANRPGAGGFVMRGVFGTVVSSNITPDTVTGIGGWTDQQVRDALTKGRRPDGTMLSPPMPWRYFATMQAADIDAVIAYVRTLRPIAQ